MNGTIECTVDENDCGDTSRRRFLSQTVGGVTAAVAVVGVGGQAASAAGIAQRMPSFATDHAPQPLPFDASSLRGLSQRIIESHWANNYGGSVKALNEINRRLAQALADPDLPAYVYNDLKREHLMRNGSVVLHELYFGNLGGSGKAGGDVSAALSAAFGDFNRWETEFRRIAGGLGGGSGWVMLGFNRQFGALENYWMADHMHCPVSTEPLLVLDMYEHSYHMDFGAAAARYIDAFIENINWEVVSARLENL